MNITPDIQGMTDAQKRLREELGRDVRFYGPADMVYDPATPASAFDDEGIPLDPLTPATAVGEAAVEIADLTLVGQVRCNVVFQPLAAIRRDPVQEDALGIRSHLNKDLIVDIDDRATVEPASHFQVGTQNENGSWTPDDTELYRIANWKTDGFGALQRLLVFGQATR